MDKKEFGFESIIEGGKMEDPQDATAYQACEDRCDIAIGDCDCAQCDCDCE